MNNTYNNGLSYGYLEAATADGTTEYKALAFSVGADGTVDIQIAPSMGAPVTMQCLAGVIYPVGGNRTIFGAGSTATGIVIYR